MTIPQTSASLPSHPRGGGGAETNLETGRPSSTNLQEAGSSPRPDENGPVAGRGLGEDPQLSTATGPVLVVIAHGNPVGQGNIRHLGAGRPAVHQNARTLLPWRDTIRHAAIAAIANTYGGRDTATAPTFPLDGPLRVEATFTVPKPAGAPKTRRTWPSKRPDGDHLLRACLDAMTHVVFVDDARCVELACAKRYPLEGTDALTYPGVVVRIYRMGDQA